MKMRKKTKLIYLLIAIILLSANLINASWLDKLSDSVNKVTKSVQKTVEKVDPKKYILQAMNSNPELYRYNREMKNKMNEINRLLKQSTSPIKKNQKEKPFKYSSSNVKMKNIMPFILQDCD
jgi:cell shape-determining protein MreC